MPGRAALQRDGVAGCGLLLEDITFARDGITIVRDVSFQVDAGRLLAVLGPSGAGKSTLLGLIAGFERADRGRIAWGDSSKDRQATTPPVSSSSSSSSSKDRQATRKVRQATTPAPTIGMSFDDAALHEHLTVAENLDSAAVPRDEPRQRRASRVRAMAEALGIDPLLSRKPATLSAGERRRVSVGRAFIRSPDVVLLDEPFANLDRGNRFTIRQMVRELQRSTGAVTVVVTHDPADALAIADDLLVLIGGSVRALGPASEVAARPPDLEVAQLVDELGMHAIELDERGESPGCRVPMAVRMRKPTLLGVRPWHVRLGAGPTDALGIRARVIAREPAGVFTDFIATRSDGRTLRARLDVSLAQDLPIGAESDFHVHREDVHLFEGPWPGRRIPEDGGPMHR